MAQLTIIVAEIEAMAMDRLNSERKNDNDQNARRPLPTTDCADQRRTPNAERWKGRACIF